MDINIKSFFKNIAPVDIIESFPVAVIGINYKKSIITWNKKARELFGYSKKDVLGKNIGFIFETDQEKIYENLSEGKKTILKATTKEQMDVFVEIFCTDLQDKDELIIAAVDVTRNLEYIESLIDEREKAKQVSQNKSKFIANLSHEFKTPMHSIIGFSQALLDNIGGDLGEKQKKYVNIISRNATNLLTLLNSILDISKIESGKAEINHKTFDIVHLINSVSESLTPLITEKKLDFSTDLTDIIKRNIYSDETILRQVLTNVLSNAVKFTETGHITLKAIHPDLEFIELHGIKIQPEQTDKSFLMFMVSDTGIGIAENELQNIFDEFRQLDKSISKKYGGTGLGLAICKKALSQIGGTIWAESEHGQGATFSIIIPIEKTEKL